MPAIAPTIDVYRGDTTVFPSFRFRAAETSPGVPGAPINVSTWTWLAQWRPLADSETVFTLDVDTASAATGWIYVSAPASVTRQMDAGGVWDLQATKPDGSVETKIRGRTRLIEDVSR